jgi:hypothetical protein
MKKITFLSLFLLIAQVAMSQAVAPYNQDFNGIVAGGDNSSIVANWNQYSYGGQTTDGDIWNGWSLNPGLAPSSDAYSLYHADDDVASGVVDNWFVLHLDCTSLDEVPFSYEEFQTYAATWYYFHGVYTSEDYDAANGDAGTQPNGTWTLLTEGAATTTPTTQSFTLPNTTTAIAFRYQGDYADNWFIDNVSVGGESNNDFSLEGTWQVTSLGVGPNQGDIGWWNNNVSSGQRACYYDDTYVFGADGSFANIQGDETWLETWQEGVEAEGCGAPVAPHNGTNAATYSYNETTGTLTVVGSGAYLGLPKAHNGGEDGFPVDDTINYIVSSNSGNAMTIDIEAGSGVWWRYEMTKDGTEEPTQTVFERLQGNVYRQIESPSDCGTCEEEINYYMFSAEGLRIIGTEYDGTCEQDDFTAFGTGDGEGEIVTNTSEEFEVCVGFLCQTITFTSDAEDEIQFDFPFFSQTWTAQLYEDEVPCLGGTGNDFSPEGTWVLTSLGVGPNQGDIGWWNNNVNSGERACYYDDTYVFNSDGSFANVLGDETWLEGWQEGVDAEGCGAPVAPHNGTNAATWSYDSATGNLTITGSGAYLGLAKAHNGGEDGFPANDTITYIVSSSSETEMTIDIEAGSGVWWRYEMQIQATAGLNDNVLNNIKMYPNPANDYLNFNANSNENLDIQIFDILGKSVLNLDNVRNPVNVSELKSGVYFVQITLGTVKETKKLIIN